MSEIKVGNAEWQCNYHKRELVILEELAPEPGYHRESVHWHKMFHHQSIKMWEHLREVFALRKLLLQFDVTVPETVEEIEFMVIVPSSGVHTFTDAELERLIAVACREQRYACVDAVTSRPRYSLGDSIDSTIQNTKAPTLSQVMEKYKKEVK